MAINHDHCFPGISANLNDVNIPWVVGSESNS